MLKQLNRTAMTCTCVASLALLGSAALLSSRVSAGPLDPPSGAVAPTYKTLGEVEPRIAINSTNTKGDANSVYRITKSGSYYLTGDVVGAVGKHGIEIAASKVTIDLMGFSLTGNALSGTGIITDGSRDDITVRNGTVSAWGGSGVDLGGGTGAGGSGACIEYITSTSNGGAGIYAVRDCVIRCCVARDNSTVGILSSINATITECVATGSGTYGIESIRGSVISRCTAVGNTTSGIVCDYSGVITHCSSTQNGDDGIVGYLGCTIEDCTSYENTGDGIRATGDCIIRGNMCSGNGTGSSIAAGIHAVGGDNRIEGNNCISNDFGIDIDTAGNMIVRNSCSGNTQNWVITSNNIFGTIVDRTAPGSGPVAGDSGPNTMGSTDPNANFSY